MKNKRPSYLRWILPVLPGAIALLLWEFFVGDSTRRQFLYGSPSSIFSIATSELVNPDFYYDVYLTTLETLLGLLVGSILGTVTGLLMWVDKRIGVLSKPYVALMGAIPSFVLAPMLIIWFGTGLTPKVVMSAFSVYLVSLVQAYEGASSASKELIQLAKSLGASRFDVLKKIVFPSALSWVFTGFKMNIGFALVGAFIGEFVISERGLGRYILKAAGLYDTPRVLFGVIVMAVISLILVGIVNFIQRRWFPWIHLEREKGTSHA